VPIAASVLGVNFVHEVGHRVAAFVRKVKLGPTYFVPNLQIGSFGGITPFASLLKNKRDLWDVAAAGPVAGVSASIALLAIGLSQSHPGGLPQVCVRARARACVCVRGGGGEGGWGVQGLWAGWSWHVVSCRGGNSWWRWCLVRAITATRPVPPAACARTHAQELLVPVPTQLFQGSLLLGSVTRLALGSDVMSRPDVLISPLVIAGWCGLITNALNLLPVGSLDGGRMVQAAFGVQALSLSAFFTYVGLGLGLLGSSLSLPFGLYVLICQRSAERYIQDNVSPIAGAKQTATAIAVLTAVLVLVPMAPEVAESVGVGSNPNLFM
jgi:membrane-associated protease RseP (regulator of RpoE activity)